MQKKQPSTMHVTKAYRPWLWLVLAGFLWLQFAGVVHKHLHTDVPLASSLLELKSESRLEQLLPEHSKSNKSDCQLLDLQCAGLALSQALPALVLPVFALQTAWHEVIFFFNSTGLDYQARAPPTASI